MATSTECAHTSTKLSADNRIDRKVRLTFQEVAHQLETALADLSLRPLPTFRAHGSFGVGGRWRRTGCTARRNLALRSSSNRYDHYPLRCARCLAVVRKREFLARVVFIHWLIERGGERKLRDGRACGSWRPTQLQRKLHGPRFIEQWAKQRRRQQASTPFPRLQVGTRQCGRGLTITRIAMTDGGVACGSAMPDEREACPPYTASCAVSRDTN